MRVRKGQELGSIVAREATRQQCFAPTCVRARALVFVVFTLRGCLAARRDCAATWRDGGVRDEVGQRIGDAAAVARSDPRRRATAVVAASSSVTSMAAANLAPTRPRWSLHALLRVLLSCSSVSLSRITQSAVPCRSRISVTVRQCRHRRDQSHQSPAQIVTKQKESPNKGAGAVTAARSRSTHTDIQTAGPGAAEAHVLSTSTRTKREASIAQQSPPPPPPPSEPPPPSPLS